MDDESRTEFRLEPRCLGRHDVAGISDIHQLLHADRIKRQSYLHLSAVHPTLQLAQPTDATHKVYTLVGSQILDAQDFI